jgi:hypothetical protein
MIVRILGEGQFAVEGPAEAKLRAIDEQLLHHLEAENWEAFRADFVHALHIVRGEGRRIADDVIAVSDFVLPRETPSPEEAKALFGGEAPPASP